MPVEDSRSGKVLNFTSFNAANRINRELQTFLPF